MLFIYLAGNCEYTSATVVVQEIEGARKLSVLLREIRKLVSDTNSIPLPKKW